MTKKLFAALALCALLAACGVSSGAGSAPPEDYWDSLPEHPPFDYFTVCWYGTMESRVFSEEAEIDYFLAEELYFLTHRGFGFGLGFESGRGPNGSWDWSYGDCDWTLFENISRLEADQPIFKAALEVPDPTEDLQREFVENETPWVKFVWSVNALVRPDGSIGILDRYLEKMPGDTIRTLRQIAIFLESPQEEGRLDCVIFTQNPETGEYLYWNASVKPGLGSWFMQELEMYAWHRIL